MQISEKQGKGTEASLPWTFGVSTSVWVRVGVAAILCGRGFLVQQESICLPQTMFGFTILILSGRFHKIEHTFQPARAAGSF